MKFNHYDLFDEMIKRFTRSYEYDIEHNKKKILECERDIRMYEHDLKRYPVWIEKSKETIEEQRSAIKEAERRMEMIKEMQLDDNI